MRLLIRSQCGECAQCLQPHNNYPWNLSHGKQIRANMAWKSENEPRRHHGDATWSDTEPNGAKCDWTEAGPGQNVLGLDQIWTNDTPEAMSLNSLLTSLHQSLVDTQGLRSVIGSLLTSQRHNLFLVSASCCHGNAHSPHGTCGSDTLWSVGRRTCVSQSHWWPACPCLLEFLAWPVENDCVSLARMYVH